MGRHDWFGQYFRAFSHTNKLKLVPFGSVPIYTDDLTQMIPLTSDNSKAWQDLHQRVSVICGGYVKYDGCRWRYSLCSAFFLSIFPCTIKPLNWQCM